MNYFIMVWRVLFVFSLTLGGTSLAFGTNFYFSSKEGDDSRNFIQAKKPETPWRSLDKLNAIFGSLHPGDTVFLKRGEVFHGSIHLRASGTSVNPVVLSAYGEGADPVISGWEKLGSWESLGNGVFRSKVTSVASKSNILLLNGHPQEMGRFPNHGFINYRIGSEKNTILSERDLSSMDLADAMLVIRKNQWVIDKHNLRSVEGDKLNFEENSGYGLMDDYGFFIQDHLQVLDSFGEWFHDPGEGKFYLYLGDSTPDQFNIKMGLIDHLVTNEAHVENIVIEDICFSGANKSNIFLKEARSIQIRNSTIEYSGENALTAIAVPDLVIVDNYINYAQNSGLYLRYGTPNAVIKRNIIEGIHLYPGMGLDGDGSGIAIHCVSDDGVIASNQISQIGYSGIVFNGNRTLVQANYIHNYCLVKNDGGGIYTFEGKENRDLEGRKIVNNIIVNGIGSFEGTRMDSKVSNPQVEGIYIDDNSSGIEITDNVVANVSRNGINLHNARNITITGNSIFNGKNQLSLAHDDLGDPIRNIQVLNNVFVASTKDYKILNFSSIDNDFSEMAFFRANKYFFPENNEFPFQINYSDGRGKRLRQSYDLRRWENGPIRDRDFKALNLLPDSYEINDITGSNGFAKSRLSSAIACLDDRNCSLIFNSAGDNSESVRINLRETQSGVKINIGEVHPRKQYLLRLGVTSEDDLVANVVLRHRGFPWSNISSEQVFKIGQSRKLIEKVFPFSDKAEAGVILLTIEDEKGSVVIDTIEWFEVDVSFQAPEVLFKYNITTLPQTYGLSGKYFDADHNELEGSITLAPFSSKILFKMH